MAITLETSLVVADNGSTDNDVGSHGIQALAKAGEAGRQALRELAGLPHLDRRHRDDILQSLGEEG